MADDKIKFAFEAVKIAIRQDKTGYVLNLSIHPSDVPEELLRSPIGTRYAVAMAEYDTLVMEDCPPHTLVVDKSVTNKPIVDKKPQFSMSRTAGILCKDERFQAWFGYFTEAATVAGLKSALGIDSRAELDQDPEARIKFLKIKGDYDTHLLENPDA